jgi:2-phosphosulfolactate phosphatase
VVIDVFRASNTILGALAAGATEVLLLAEIQSARKLKRAHPEHLLLRERDGVMPSGFDGNNSPAAVGSRVSPGQSVILTTSAGTQAVNRVRRAERVTVASFANASAVRGRQDSESEAREPITRCEQVRRSGPVWFRLCWVGVE